MLRRPAGVLITMSLAYAAFPLVRDLELAGPEHIACSEATCCHRDPPRNGVCGVIISDLCQMSPRISLIRSLIRCRRRSPRRLHGRHSPSMMSLLRNESPQVRHPVQDHGCGLYLSRILAATASRLFAVSQSIPMSSVYSRKQKAPLTGASTG